jgi:hypothetical protein
MLPCRSTAGYCGVREFARPAHRKQEFPATALPNRVWERGEEALRRLKDDFLSKLFEDKKTRAAKCGWSL